MSFTPADVVAWLPSSVFVRIITEYWPFQPSFWIIKCLIYAKYQKGELSTSLGSWIFRLHLLKASAGVEKCMGDISRNCFMWCKIRFTCQLQTIIGYLASKVWLYLKIWRAQIRMLATRCHYFIISPRSPPSWWAHKNLRVSCRHSSSYTSLLQRSAKIDVRGCQLVMLNKSRNNFTKTAFPDLSW